uniref:Uncharacterized protein n=1 Tax=Cannabis sativa TaxID=3483 RepID=A0A803R8R9_CANSA
MVQLISDCTVVSIMVEANSTCRHPIKDILCRCFAVRSSRVSSIRWKTFLDVATISCRIKGATKEAAGGWLRDNHMLFMFPYQMHNGLL